MVDLIERLRWYIAIIMIALAVITTLVLGISIVYIDDLALDYLWPFRRLTWYETIKNETITDSEGRTYAVKYIVSFDGPQPPYVSVKISNNGDAIGQVAGDYVGFKDVDGDGDFEVLSWSRSRWALRGVWDITGGRMIKINGTRKSSVVLLLASVIQKTILILLVAWLIGLWGLFLAVSEKLKKSG